MRKILSWYRFHLFRSFEFDRAWPWQKVYWMQMGCEDERYGQEHGFSWPWKKTFWLAPNMKRLYSILMVMVGLHAFIIALMLLIVVAHFFIG